MLSPSLPIPTRQIALLEPASSCTETAIAVRGRGVQAGLHGHLSTQYASLTEPLFVMSVKSSNCRAFWSLAKYAWTNVSVPPYPPSAVGKLPSSKDDVEHRAARKTKEDCMRQKIVLLGTAGFVALLAMGGDASASVNFRNAKLGVDGVWVSPLDNPILEADWSGSAPADS